MAEDDRIHKYQLLSEMERVNTDFKHSGMSVDMKLSYPLTLKDNHSLFSAPQPGNV